MEMRNEKMWKWRVRKCGNGGFWFDLYFKYINEPKTFHRWKQKMLLLKNRWILE